MQPNAPDLRATLRAARKAIAPAQRMAAASAVAEQVLSLPSLPAIPAYIAGYWAMDGELPLHVLQLQLPDHLIWCLPMLHAADNTLRFAPWRTGNALVTNRFGIPEPDIDPASALQASEMQMVLMPLLGFDSQCNRIGMGGGWYDRSFAFRKHASAPPVLIGVGFDAQRVDHLVPNDWDVRCGAVCTESTTYQAAP